MTVGLPAILARYEQATGKAAQTRIIVDRDQMADQFLAELVAAGRTVVTVLRSSNLRWCGVMASRSTTALFVDASRSTKLLVGHCSDCETRTAQSIPGHTMPLPGRLPAQASMS